MAGCAYFLVAGIVGLGAGYLGTWWGVLWACHPGAGNLCGLFGFFVSGPIAGIVTFILVAVVLFRRFEP
jgi:hypothetical protein